MKYLQIFSSKARDSSRDIVPSPNLSMAWSPEHDEGHRVWVECVPEEDPTLVSCGGHCTLPHAGVKLCGGCLKEDIDGRLLNLGRKNTPEKTVLFLFWHLDSKAAVPMRRAAFPVVLAGVQVDQPTILPPVASPNLVFCILRFVFCTSRKHGCFSTNIIS